MNDKIDHEKLEESVRTLLGHAYTPPQPRVVFQANLLDTLKARQQELASARINTPGKITLLKLFPAAVAAVAALLLVVALPRDILTATPAVSAPFTMTRPDAAESIRVGALAIEYNKDGEWQQIDTPQHLTLRAGTRIRTGTVKREAGIGMEDGVRIMLLPESGASYTEKGFQLDYGKAIVKVPQKAGSFPLHLSQQNVFVEPGTIVQVEVGNPDLYAPGGAPAPAVSIYDGGLAFSGNDNTVAPLFAGNRYQLHNFQTRDIPGRPMGGAEQYSVDYDVDLMPAGIGKRLRSRVGDTFSTRSATDKQREFRYENETWMDPAYTSGTLTKKIKYLSREYISLLKNHRNLCDALALGRSVIVKHNDGFIEIVE